MHYLMRIEGFQVAAARSGQVRGGGGGKGGGGVGERAKGQRSVLVYCRPTEISVSRKRPRLERARRAVNVSGERRGRTRM